MPYDVIIMRSLTRFKLAYIYVIYIIYIVHIIINLYARKRVHEKLTLVTSRDEVEAAEAVISLVSRELPYGDVRWLMRTSSILFSDRDSALL